MIVRAEVGVLVANRYVSVVVTGWLRSETVPQRPWERRLCSKWPEAKGKGKEFAQNRVVKTEAP